MITTPGTNNLSMKTKYEDLDRIGRIISFESNYRVHMDMYFREMLMNFKKVAGYIYTEADLKKLNAEKRPSFVYNLLAPILMKLAGNYLDNQSRVEAQPRTPDDFKTAKIMTDLLDYSHYTANDVSRELGLAFLFAAIGRVGWITNEWSYFNNREGMNWIYCTDPFSIMWDGAFTRRDLRTTPAIIKRAWYTPEELKTRYSYDDEEMAAEIEEKARMYVGVNNMDRRLSYVERTFGTSLTYPGKEQGYDSITRIVDGMLYNNGSYFDAFRGAFKVIQAHERRNVTVWTMFDGQKQWNITEAIEADGNKFNNDKMQYLKEKYRDPIIEHHPEELIYQTDICPAFNMKLYDEPYAVQNGLFKDIPVFCLDFGTQSIEWKSYVDLIADSVISLNLSQNTIQTYLMKATHGERWVEEDALGEHREEFMDNRVGAVKTVANGAISQGKIKIVEPPNIPSGLFQNLITNQNLIQEQTGIHDNAQGKQESSSESGTLFAQRVAQSDKMVAWAMDNATSQLVRIGTWTKDLFRRYLEPGRVIKIVGDNGSPAWVELNQDSIRKINYNSKGEFLGEDYVNSGIKDCDYDIVLSKAPFGELAKQREFDRTMFAINTIGKINPAYVDPEIVVEVSDTRFRDRMVDRIKKVDMQAAQQAVEMMQEAAQQKQVAEREREMQVTDKKLDLTHKAIDTGAMLAQATNQGLA